MRVERKPLGGRLYKFTGFASADGKSWAQIANSIDIAMGPTSLVGMAVTSHVEPTPPPGAPRDPGAALAVTVAEAYML